MALLAIVATALIGAFLSGQSGIATAGQRARASFLAEEGLEAVRNIADAGYSNLVDGTYGLVLSGSVWTLAGSSDATDIFTRQVTVASIDADRKQVNVTVTWQQNPQRTGSVNAASYFSNWRKTGGHGGMLAYSDRLSSGDTIRYKILGGDGVWSAENTVPSLGVPGSRPATRIELYAAPTSNEKILISRHFGATGPGVDQYLYAQVWNGSAWGNAIQLASWDTLVTPEARNFDGTYLSDGTFLVVFDNETNTPQYRTWNGSSWSTESATLDIGGNPTWIVTRAQPATNFVIVAIADASKRTRTIQLDGSV